VIAKYLARMAAHITNELRIYLATQALRIAKRDATAADASHSKPTRLNKKIDFWQHSIFASQGWVIYICCAVYFACLRHRDVLRLADIRHPLFCTYACFCKILISHLPTILATIMSDSFLHKPANDDYFYHQPFVHAAYTSQQHIALLCFAQPAKIKNETPSNKLQQTCTKKQKVKNIQTQKIDKLHNDHIFYHAATTMRHFVICNFLQ